MNRRKSITLAILVVLLLTFAVSGTIAYITTQSGPVENVFTPAKVDTEIEEEFNDNNVKTSVVIKNTVAAEYGGIPVYVRVAIVGNYVDNTTGEIVAAWTPSFTVDSGWTMVGDYYYYTSEVAPGGETTNLLGSPISPDTATYPNAHLEVTVIHQSIQSEPTSAAQSAWGYVPGSTSSN